MARHAELQTVDENHTVFLQGLYIIPYCICLLAPFPWPVILVRSSFFIHRFDLLLCVLGLIGDVGGEFYFVLQGSVAIKLNNEVIKVSVNDHLFYFAPWSFKSEPLACLYLRSF